MYSQQSGKGENETISRYSGGLIVAFSLMIHIELVAAILKRVIRFGDDTGFVSNKNFLIPIVLAFIGSTIIYYNKARTEKILKKYAYVEYPTSFINYFKVLTAIVVPLVVIIILATK